MKKAIVKKVLISVIAVMICAAVAAVVFGSLKKKDIKADDKQIRDLIAAYVNAQSGYTKFPEDSDEAYYLAYEKLRNMPYERVNLEAQRSVKLESVSGSMNDKQSSDLEDVFKEYFSKLDSSFESVFLDYGEDVRGYIPDISSVSPVRTASETDKDGNYVITLYLSAKDAQTLVTDEFKRLLETDETQKLSGPVSVNSAAASVTDGSVRIVFNVYNSYISEITTTVNCSVNLGCEFSGRLRSIEAQNILLGLALQTRCSSSREGIYFSEKSFSLAKNRSSDLNYRLMISPGLDTDDYKVSFASADTSTVQVDENGRITALEMSDAPVPVYVYLKIDGGNSYHDTCEVYVSVPVSDIKLDRKELSMKKGTATALSANVLPENASDKSVIWLSANKKVAEVSEDGVVTAVGAGETEIVAFIKDGTVYRTCDITVEE